MRLGRELKLALAIGIVGIMLLSTLGMACPQPPPCEVKLWAGQTTLAATITITLEGDGDVRFDFDMKDGWKVYELHIHIDDALGGMPANKKGNLMPGKFEWKASYSSGMDDFTATVGDAFVPDDGNFYIIVHAVVMKCDMDETGWANKCETMDYFNPDGPGWATYVYFS